VFNDERQSGAEHSLPDVCLSPHARRVVTIPPLAITIR
jgi:hypothetical protein